MEASNPIVKSALVPVLQLCSYFISHSHMYGCWDALFFGDLDDIPKGQLLQSFQNRRYARVWRRPRGECCSEQGIKQLQDAFLKVAGNIDWEFQASRISTHSGLPFPSTGNAMGLTSDNYVNNPKVYVSLELFESLIGADLNQAEIALDVFRAASTILHELTVGHTH
jgi:hypothetical protein